MRTTIGTTAGSRRGYAKRGGRPLESPRVKGYANDAYRKLMIDVGSIRRASTPPPNHPERERLFERCRPEINGSCREYASGVGCPPEPSNVTDYANDADRG